jgi:hypothetical protein
MVVAAVLGLLREHMAMLYLERLTTLTCCFIPDVLVLRLRRSQANGGCMGPVTMPAWLTVNKGNSVVSCLRLLHVRLLLQMPTSSAVCSLNIERCLDVVQLQFK